jgi:uncharacterized membrane protein
MADLVDTIIMFLSVFVSAAAELVTGVPVGLAFGLDMWTAGLITALGGIVGGGFTIFLGKGITRIISHLFKRIKIKLAKFAERRQWQWLSARLKEKESIEGEPAKENKREGFLRRVWVRFGVVGLGLLAPLITGVPLGAFIGTSLGSPHGKLFLWISIGVILWTGIFMLTITLGFESLELLGF